jgi:hypothetical protein
MIDVDMQAIRNALLRANAITEMVRLASQTTGDEFRPCTVYEAMLAIQDGIDLALEELKPLVQEQDSPRHKILYSGAE